MCQLIVLQQLLFAKKIEIYDYIKFENKTVADTVMPDSDITYREATITGIIEGWEGEYEGRKLRYQ